MSSAGASWIAALPSELKAQRNLLEGLLVVAADDADIAWLTLGCSLARGAGDPLSDLDAAMGATGDQIEPVVARIADKLRALAPVIDLLEHRLAGVAAPHRRLFVQYADRSQIDLVVAPAEPASFSPATVVLYDPTNRVKLNSASPVTAAEIREWAFLACCALADLGKYLRRGSPWEALTRLDEARTQLWKLAAATRGVRDPKYGLTSFLDFLPRAVPAEMADVVAGLDPARILAASRRAAALLAIYRADLPNQLGDDFPDAMLAFVANDLAGLTEG